MKNFFTILTENSDCLLLMLLITLILAVMILLAKNIHITIRVNLKKHKFKVQFHKKEK